MSKSVGGLWNISPYGASIPRFVSYVSRYSPIPRDRVRESTSHYDIMESRLARKCVIIDAIQSRKIYIHILDGIETTKTS